MLRIGFLCLHDSRDKRQFSGTPYYLVNALKRLPQVEVEVLGETAYPNQESFLFKVLSKGLALTSKFPIFKSLELQFKIRRYTRAAAQDLRKLDPSIDCIIGLVASRLIPQLSQITGCPPIYLVTDATIQFILECYGGNPQLPSYSEERNAISLCSGVFYSSRYMAERAMKEYPSTACVIEKHIYTVQFGMNLELNTDAYPVEAKDQIELLFIGSTWERKGGDTAVNILEELRAQNVNASLTLIGPCPKDFSSHPHIRELGSLDKNKEDQYLKIINALKMADFLLLPSQADCTPMVVAEANAFGVPVLAKKTGGMASVVCEQNGFLFNQNAKSDEFVSTIVDFSQNEQKLNELRASSKNWQREVLNWDTWAHSVVAHIHSISTKQRQK